MSSLTVVILIGLIASIFYLYKKGFFGKKDVLIEAWKKGIHRGKSLLRKHPVEHVEDYIQHNMLISVAIECCEELGDDLYRNDLSKTVLAETCGISYQLKQMEEGKQKYPTINNDIIIRRTIKNDIKEINKKLLPLKKEVKIYLSSSSKNDDTINPGVNKIIELMENLKKENNRLKK